MADDSYLQVDAMLQQIDGDIGYLMEELERRDMHDINVMIVSDHGFADVDEDVVYLDQCPGLNTSMFSVTENDPVIFVWPRSTVPGMCVCACVCV